MHAPGPVVPEDVGVVGSKLAHTYFLEWCSITPPLNVDRNISFFEFIGLLFSPIVNRSFRVGGFEGASNHYRMLTADADHDGSVRGNEYDDLTKQLVENVSGLLVNMGVVGALILSVFTPLVLTPMELSASSKDFFGEKLTYVFWCGYQLMIVIVVALSLLLVMFTVFHYKHLNFWMPTNDAKLWYLDTFSIVPVIITASLTLIFAFCAVVLGTSCLVSATASLFSMVALLVFTYGSVWINMVETRSWLYLHHLCHHTVVKMKADGDRRAIS
jgi:hypothetical protein